jgi:aspartokinase
MDLDRCVEARVRTERAIVTLVGDGVRQAPAIAARMLAAVKNSEAFVVSGDRSPPMLTIAASVSARETTLN